MGCNVNVDADPKFKFVEFTLGFASVTFLFGDSIFKLCVLMEISLFFLWFCSIRFCGVFKIDIH